MSEEPGFTPNSPLTRKPKRSHLFLIVLMSLFIAVAATVVIYRFAGETVGGVFFFAWMIPLIVVCRRLWFGIQRRDGTGSWFDAFWRRWP